jgi:hypothetical protein
MNAIYQLANVFFFVFHIGLILFNLFGWLFKPLRKWNLITLGLTAFSWFGLGIFYGFGYCFLTDWHWAVREELGYVNTYNSYIRFLIAVVFRVELSERVVNIATAVLFFAAVIASVKVNFVVLRKRRESS